MTDEQKSEYVTHRRYVCGFAFTPDTKWVLLLQKKHGPKKLIGRLNGVGGAVNEGESVQDAMRREFFEEAGIECPDFKHFCTLNWDGGDCSFFTCSTLNPDQTYPAENDVGEPLCLFSANAGIGSLNWRKLSSEAGLDWLLPMARAYLERPNSPAWPLNIYEACWAVLPI